MSFTRPHGDLLSGLLGDAAVEAAFAPQADVAAMLRFEAALARAEAAEGVVPAAAADAIAAALADLKPDLAALAAGVVRDGVAAPDLVRQIRAAVGPPHDADVHRGATSQDLADTSLMLRIGPVLDLLADRAGAIAEALDGLARRSAGRTVTARTRMQDALPVSAGDRVALWREPIVARAAALRSMRRDLPVQFAGAVGTLSDLGGRGPAVRARLAASLGLADPGRSWHADRAVVAEIGHRMAALCGALGKVGQDVALMALSGGEIALAGGGGSSAMPHKRNPIRAEVLVALARQAATLAGGLGQALVHEQERSGAAWTLEWLLLPDLAVATGAATANALALAGQIECIGRPA